MGLYPGGPPVTTVESRSLQLEDEDKAGFEDPLDMVYRLHAQPLHRFLMRVTRGDRREAEDLLQETFLRAWNYLQNHAADVESLRPWLYTVARRIAIAVGRVEPGPRR